MSKASNIKLQTYLPSLPDEALKEFVEWCILEHVIEAGYEFTPNAKKLADLDAKYYIEELVDQFVKATRNSIDGGLAILLAGKEADTSTLEGILIIVDFIALYVKYLVPKGSKNTLPPDEKLEETEKEQFNKLSEIAKKYNVVM